MPKHEIEIPEEYKRVKGAYALPRLEGQAKTVLIEVPQEDIGKIEAVAGRQMLAIVESMKGILSGKSDPGDLSPSHTLARELGEEFKLYKPPKAFTNGLPKVEVQQIRSSGKFLLEATGHRFDVTPEDITIIENVARVLLVADEALDQAIEKEFLRPAVHGILYKVSQFLKEGNSI